MSGKEIDRRVFIKTALGGAGLLVLSGGCGKERIDPLMLTGRKSPEVKKKSSEIVEFKHSSCASDEFFSALDQNFNIALRNTCALRLKNYYPEELNFKDVCEFFNQLPWGSLIWRDLVQTGMGIFYEMNEKVMDNFGEFVFSSPLVIRESIEDRSRKFQCEISARNQGFSAQGYWEACYEFGYNYSERVSKDKKMFFWINAELIPNPEDKLLPYKVRLYPQQISYASYNPEDLFQNMNVLISLGEERQKTGHLPSKIIDSLQGQALRG